MACKRLLRRGAREGINKQPQTPLLRKVSSRFLVQLTEKIRNERLNMLIKTSIGFIDTYSALY